MSDVHTGAAMIMNERERQKDEEGWNAEHDDQENNYDQLAMAAACYAMAPYMPMPEQMGATIPWDIPIRWPWAPKWWKPTGCEYGVGTAKGIDGRIRDLTKAGALIAAEIDRLRRLKDKKQES